MFFRNLCRTTRTILNPYMHLRQNTYTACKNPYLQNTCPFAQIEKKECSFQWRKNLKEYVHNYSLNTLCDWKFASKQEITACLHKWWCFTCLPVHEGIRHGHRHPLSPRMALIFQRFGSFLGELVPALSGLRSWRISGEIYIQLLESTR